MKLRIVKTAQGHFHVEGLEAGETEWTHVQAFTQESQAREYVQSLMLSIQQQRAQSKTVVEEFELPE